MFSLFALNVGREEGEGDEEEQEGDPVGSLREGGGFPQCSQTDRQTGTDRQAGGGGGREEEGWCALSCLNENKQLSDPLQT